MFARRTSSTLVRKRDRGNGRLPVDPSVRNSLHRLRPAPPLSNRFWARENLKPRVLVLGVYLADRSNNAEAIIDNFARSAKFCVSQRWAGVSSALESLTYPCTSLRIVNAEPKFTLINELIGEAELEFYDYLVVCDDDISLPPRFLDDFISLQRRLDFRLAQPARTQDSYIDHDIVRQRVGCLARQTLFVECGPLFCMHRSVYAFLLPFQEESPMGWGYENVWSWRLSQRSLQMGVIDSIPVEHKMRKPGSYYDSEQARRAQAKLLAAHPHNREETCKRVVRVFVERTGQHNSPPPGIAFRGRY
jgi:hypothetical protein